MFLSLLLAAKAATNAVGEADDVRSGLANRVAGFFDYLIGQIPSWIAGFVVFALTIFVAKLAKSAVESRISDQIDEEHQEVLVLSGRITFFAIMAVGITVALKIAGIDITTIVAAGAFGIGFALRDLISNFIAGIMILLSRQFKIGDFLKIGSTTGRVMEIQTRATILKALDGTKVIVPNSEIFSNVVISTTTNPFRRIDIPLYISYDSDIKYAIKVAMEEIKKNKKILKKPAPSVIVKDYGDSSIDLSARFWVGSRDGWLKIRSDMLRIMYEAFNEAGIVIPYDVLHLETSQDVSAEWTEAKEKTRKRKTEMSFKKNTEAEAAGNLQPRINENPQQELVAQSAPVLAVETIPVTTEGELQDLDELDGQG